MSIRTYRFVSVVPTFTPSSYSYSSTFEKCPFRSSASVVSA